MDFISSVKRLSESASASEDMQPAMAAVAEADLIPSLWQELPVELLQKVLTKLPVSVLMKFLRVSKGWKDWIQSDEFGRNYDLVQSAVFYFNFEGGRSYIALPSSKNDIWEKHFLEFVHDDEVVFGLVAADRGLLCYKILKRVLGDRSRFSNRRRDPLYEIVLVVQNPLTRKWRRLVVPHRLETDLFFWHWKMLVGLTVDPEAGSYKVVVAFINENFKDSGNAFIYDSSSRTWGTSTAASPVLDEHDGYGSWKVPRSIHWGGELIWLVNETDTLGSGVGYKSLIKYSLEEDTWCVVTERWPVSERPWVENGDAHIVHQSVENRLVLVDFNHFDSVDSLSHEREYIPALFLNLVPCMGMFGSEDLCELFDRSEENGFPVYFEPQRAAYGGGIWFVTSESDSSGFVLDVFAFSDRSSRSRAVPLPKLCDSLLFSQGLDTFEATFKVCV